LKRSVIQKIPLIRPTVGGEELEEVRKVLESGWLAQGPKVKEFEAKLAEYLEAKYVVASNSCTSALSLALEALELKPGSEVVFPDFTFPATGNVVVRAGLKPVIADVDLETYAVSVETLKRAVSSRTSAIMPVHPFGFPVALDEIYEFAESKGIAVIEDAATAFGTVYHGKKVGSRGRAICFSFHPRKALTTGEGGCIVTDDRRVYELAGSFRNHGIVYRGGKPSFEYSGLNYRLSDINAAVGVAQLAKFDRIIASRRKKAQIYTRLLRKSGADLYVQAAPEDSIPTFQSFVIRLGKRFKTIRDECIKSLSEHSGIETQIGTYSLSIQPSFSRAKRPTLLSGPLLYESTLTLPLYDSLTEEQQRFVVDSLVALA
jgi:perosamine synthetase